MLLDKLSIHSADKFPIILLGMCSPVILIQEKKVMHIWTSADTEKNVTSMLYEFYAQKQHDINIYQHSYCGWDEQTA